MAGHFPATLLNTISGLKPISPTEVGQNSIRCGPPLEVRTFAAPLAFDWNSPTSHPDRPWTGNPSRHGIGTAKHRSSPGMIPCGKLPRRTQIEASGRKPASSWCRVPPTAMWLLHGRRVDRTNCGPPDFPMLDVYHVDQPVQSGRSPHRTGPLGCALAIGSNGVSARASRGFLSPLPRVPPPKGSTNACACLEYRARYAGLACRFYVTDSSLSVSASPVHTNRSRPPSLARYNNRSAAATHSSVVSASPGGEIPIETVNENASSGQVISIFRIACKNLSPSRLPVNGPSSERTMQNSSPP